MKAIVCSALDGVDGLAVKDIERPESAAGHVRIRVRAAAINFADTLIIKGQYQVRPELPFVPGIEGAGEVVEVGDGVSIPVGTRVMFVAGVGAWSEEVVVAEPMVVAIPDAMSWEDAASFPVAWGTSHIALDHRAQLQPGETVLVHGAAGGVGLTAVAIAKQMGATVIATAGSDARLQVAAAAGADHLINYRSDDFRARVKELTGGRGADVIYDPVGGDVFDASLRCINWCGRLLTIGFAAGRVPKAPANILLVKNIAVIGVHWGAYAERDPATMRSSLETLVEWFADGAIRGTVSSVRPFEAVHTALRDLLARKTTGKVVLRLE